MVAYFPSLYPDELLYSGIARYHQLSGNIAQKHTIRDLFGNHLACATVDLPSHLKYLSERLGSVYSVRELIMKHTLYPYYSSFISKNRASKAYDLMSEGAPQGKVHVLLGIPASTIKLPGYLRYCSICYEEDLSLFHEPYWHRSHQAPGVYVCQLHKKVLMESKISYVTRGKKFGFTPLIELEREDSQTIHVHPECLYQYEMVAARSYELLSATNMVPDCSRIAKVNLIEKGYLTAQGRIRFLKLIRDFNTHFPPEFLRHMQCEVDGALFESWLHKMIRGQDLMFHPIRHILVGNFFGLTKLDVGEQYEYKYQEVTRKGGSTEHENNSRSPNQILDWRKRDELTLTEVKQVVIKIKLQETKPRRISLSLVSNSLDKFKVPFVLEKCLNKLPKTKRFLAREIESTEGFQIRRLEWAAAQLVSEGTKIQGWRLLKAAGLNRPLRRSVEEKFNSLCHYYFEKTNRRSFICT
ncbi:hypothetical protein GT019_16815 [Paenibacillus sp. T1]|uniref:Transposon Tn7 transposition protein TnsD C-termianl domain-containing protein n=1 Tax=Paenibacillus glycinis TaxID=2697035 RepID=A0ABW9XSA5_9BACL|nr:hypothetical protein [Paenibacillus glycinis]